ncbi:zinc finger protein CONSTANS-LIKE 3 [Herrania umbratica]|uniref:Zinc finger protein CONSTANS-LIKE 3 n=1 Tax=Herrania umbratica TaxID=108875 RepID=A0A6J1AQ29_9ROSI|nr:zinc finger protein CONSTANS-LIKE 3 [Herrania umbratica]
MASVPQFYSNYSLSNDYSQFQNPLLISQDNYIGSAGAIPGAAWGDQEIGFPMFLDNGGGLDAPPQEPNITSPVPAALFPELIGISSDLAVPAGFPDNNVAGFCGIGTIQNFGGRYQLQDVCEFGEECSGFVHQDFKPVDPTVGENWGIQGSRMQPAMEDSNLKVGRYSVEERKDRILRYLKKRNQRNFNKTIKYACRKTLADRRVRVRGRFARNTELCEEEMVMKKEDDNSPSEKNSYCWDSVQIKHDEDEWLQEAMANLMYLPYIAG